MRKSCLLIVDNCKLLDISSVIQVHTVKCKIDVSFVATFKNVYHVKLNNIHNNHLYWNYRACSIKNIQFCGSCQWFTWNENVYKNLQWVSSHRHCLSLKQMWKSTGQWNREELGVTKYTPSQRPQNEAVFMDVTKYTPSQRPKNEAVFMDVETIWTDMEHLFLKVLVCNFIDCLFFITLCESSCLSTSLVSTFIHHCT